MASARPSFTRQWPKLLQQGTGRTQSEGCRGHSMSLKAVGVWPVVCGHFFLRRTASHCYLPAMSPAQTCSSPGIVIFAGMMGQNWQLRKRRATSKFQAVSCDKFMALSLGTLLQTTTPLPARRSWPSSALLKQLTPRPPAELPRRFPDGPP